MTSFFTAVAAGTVPERGLSQRRLLGQTPSGSVPPTSRSSGHGLGQVLVASARQADQDRLFVELERFGKRMCGLEGRDDAFRLGEPAERGQGFLVGRAQVLRPARVA